MRGRPPHQLVVPKGRYGIEIGSVVSIFIITGDENELTFEGRATVVSVCRHDRFFFRVRFLRETVDRIRVVLPPSPHNNPALFVEAMRELIRTRGLNPWPEFWSD